jgi:glyoxylase-like metal-dependent hydrolase (beta-lactamase superfamily II)
MTAIHTLDLHYLGTPEAIASYILVGRGGPVMIETGPGRSTDALASGLNTLGYEPSDVKHVLVTHIHFDHAGASGWMARHGAQIHVHEFGAPHLIEPTRLVESARRIYGEQMDELWGELIPIPEGQVSPVHDNDVIEVEGIAIRAIETPGHARHHHAFAVDTDEGRICFTGDAAATYIPNTGSFVSVPTPPPEFDLERWIASIERLEAERFDRICPTHFGAVNDPAGHLARVKPTLRAHAEFVRKLMDENAAREEILARYTDWWVTGAKQAGVPERKLHFYINSMAEMNVTGIMRYWTKRAEKATA